MKRSLFFLCLFFLWTELAKGAEPPPCSRQGLEGLLKNAERRVDFRSTWQSYTAQLLLESRCAAELPMQAVRILKMYNGFTDRAAVGAGIARALSENRELTDKVCREQAIQKSVGLEIQESLGVLYEACHLKRLEFASRDEFVGLVPGRRESNALPNRWERLAGAVLFQAMVNAGMDRKLARTLGRSLSGIAQVGFADRPYNYDRLKPEWCSKSGSACAVVASPFVGSTSGGEKIEILGTGLSPGIGKVRVKFGGETVRQVLVGSNSILMITPAGTPGTPDAELDLADGSHLGPLGVIFEYAESAPPRPSPLPDGKPQVKPGSKEGLSGLRGPSDKTRTEISESEHKEIALMRSAPVLFESLEVFGPIQYSAVSTTLSRGREDYERCLQAAAPEKASGRRIAATWEITPTGQVSNLAMDRIGAKNGKLEACMSAAVANWRFDKPTDGYTASVMVVFSVR